MIPATRLIYEVTKKLDRLNSHRLKAARIEDKCSALSEAQRFLFKDRVSHFEENNRYRQELRLFEKKEVRFERLSITPDYTTFKIPDDFYRDLRMRVVASKEPCGKKYITVTKFETDDLNRGVYDNTFWKASYEWEIVAGDEGGGMIYIYNSTAFNVDDLIVDYIFPPDDIHCPSLTGGSYQDADGKIQTKDSGWAWDQTYDEGVNLAVLYLTRDFGDANDFTIQSQTISQNETFRKL